ncbi:hypothetical protein AB0M72_16780 [Nocardiopsis dassonvillei]|uniref:hypothetical protein n=1 Tax=Nocardiopsis dassonvillei TaxID=2014 RepID=UPI00200D5368|nr:hypothetical protein [Nocardiopsis dassonvillei]MCK9872126.1 hypothetical protein [Nocardiopsis dassonvillei]
METTTVLVLVIAALMVVGVIGAAVAGSAAERRRSRALSLWASREGWRYDRERPELVDRFEGVPFLERRSNARARHVLCAELRGRRVLAYEYGYAAPHPQQRHRTVAHVYTVVAVALPAGVPLLQVEEAGAGAPQPRTDGSRAWTAGEAAFDERFAVVTGDEAFAATVLGEPVREWLLSREGVCPFRLGGRYLVAWERGPLETGRVRERADAAIGLLERVPAGVWESAQDTLG